MLWIFLFCNSAALLPRLCALVRTLDGINSGAVSTLLAPPSTSALAALEESKVVDPDADVDPDAVVVNGKRQPTNYRHVVVETEHPYVPAVKSKWELEFPADVTWLIVEFDAKCVTAQAEDRVSLFFDPELRQKIGNDFSGKAGDDDAR